MHIRGAKGKLIVIKVLAFWQMAKLKFDKFLWGQQKGRRERKSRGATQAIVAPGMKVYFLSNRRKRKPHRKPAWSEMELYSFHKMQTGLSQHRECIGNHSTKRASWFVRTSYLCIRDTLFVNFFLQFLEYWMECRGRRWGVTRWKHFLKKTNQYISSVAYTLFVNLCLKILLLNCI